MATKVGSLRVERVKDSDDMAKQLNSILRKIQDKLNEHDDEITALKSNAR